MKQRCINALLFSALFAAALMLDRVLAGFLQCEAAQSCPWGER